MSASPLSILAPQAKPVQSTVSLYPRPWCLCEPCQDARQASSYFFAAHLAAWWIE